MGWLDEAQEILKNKAEAKAGEDAGAGAGAGADTLTLATEAERRAFMAELLDIYEEASEREAELALDRVIEHFSFPCLKKDVLLYVKQFLED